MYNYIFWTVYNRNISRNKGEWLSRQNASGVVFFAIFIHLFFIIEIIKRFWFNLDLKYLTENTGISILGVFFFILVTYLYYSKSRIAKINYKYSKNQKIVERSNGWIVLLIIFIPLLLIIIFGWKG
jgi:hypothetical protein